MKLGFKAILNDQFVFKMKVIIKSQFHVDDLMITCKDEAGITYVVTCHELNNEYSKANVHNSDTVGNLDKGNCFEL